MKPKLIKNLYLSIFILVIIFTIIFIYTLNKKAISMVMDYANIQTKRIGIEVLRSTGTKEVNALLKDREMFKVIKNNNGEIESIDFDTKLINDSLIIISNNVRKRLNEIENGKNLPKELYSTVMDKSLKKGIIYEVPVSVVFGSSILYDVGPKIPVKVKYSGNVGLDVKTKVKKYGLDSALIEVYIYVEVTQSTVLPLKSKETKLVSEIPVALKIIKGSIPNYQLQNGNLLEK